MSTGRGHQSEDAAGARPRESDPAMFSAIHHYLSGLVHPDNEEEESSPILEDVSIQGIIDIIKAGKCKHIITLAGAGISTSSGIPDFRSPGSGLYDNLQKYNLPDPQAIFEIGFFRQNPQPFFALAKELYPGSFKPTICHYFIRLLHEKGLLLRHYTQNIDTLERVAGLPDRKLVEAHGTFHTSHCLGCNRMYSQEWVKEHVFSDTVPTCEECNGIVKPDIVFFGENMPDRFFSYAKKDFRKCDLLIIMGSSLTVEPFASLVDKVPETCPRLLINRTKAGRSSTAYELLGLRSGLEFDRDGNTRDVLWLGDCDDGCLELATGLGWDDELRKLVDEEHKRITLAETNALIGEELEKRTEASNNQTGIKLLDKEQRERNTSVEMNILDGEEVEKRTEASGKQPIEEEHKPVTVAEANALDDKEVEKGTEASGGLE